MSVGFEFHAVSLPYRVKVGVNIVSIRAPVTRPGRQAASRQFPQRR